MPTLSRLLIAIVIPACLVGCGDTFVNDGAVTTMETSNREPISPNSVPPGFRSNNPFVPTGY